MTPGSHHVSIISSEGHATSPSSHRSTFLPTHTDLVGSGLGGSLWCTDCFQTSDLLPFLHAPIIPCNAMLKWNCSHEDCSIRHSAAIESCTDCRRHLCLAHSAEAHHECLVLDVSPFSPLLP